MPDYRTRILQLFNGSQTHYLKADEQIIGIGVRREPKFRESSGKLDIIHTPEIYGIVIQDKQKIVTRTDDHSVELLVIIDSTTNIVSGDWEVVGTAHYDMGSFVTVLQKINNL